MTLKIEEGRYYQNRQGDIVGPMTRFVGIDTGWDDPFRTAYEGVCNGRCWVYCDDGKRMDGFLDGEDSLDLVREAEEPVSVAAQTNPPDHPLQIEAGRYYWNRVGLLVGPMIPDAEAPYWSKVYSGACGDTCARYYEAGRRVDSLLGEGPLDLVREAPAPDEPAPEPFKIQVGRYYKTRQGDIVGPVRSTASWANPASAPFYTYHPSCGCLMLHQEDGSWARRTNPASSLDLIEEVPAPKDLAEATEAPETARDPVSAIIEDRGRVYGDARTSFGRIAGLWNAYAGLSLTRHDVAMMLTLLKVSRIHGAPDHADSYLDAKAYLELAERISEEDDEDY